MIHLSRIPKLTIPALAAALLTGILPPHESRGEDLSEILRQISEEKSGKTSEKKNTSVAAEPTPKKKAQPKKSQAAKPKVQAVQPPVAPAPRWIVYGPKDKLPKNLEGCAVAGNFIIIGEDVFGGAELVPADTSLLFARRFIVKNFSSGYAPGTILHPDQYRKVHVPRERPLLFLGRDFLPGHYLVRAQ